MTLSLNVSALTQEVNVEQSTASKFLPIHKEKFKLLTGEHDGEYINHAVTAYGFQNRTISTYFIVHYGWCG